MIYLFYLSRAFALCHLKASVSDIEALDKAGQLKRVKTRVSANLEIAEIMRAHGTIKINQRYHLRNVQDSTMPILGNAFGTLQRLQIALDSQNFNEIGERIVELTRMKIPSGILNKLRLLPKFSEIAEYGPKVRGLGACYSNN